MQPPRSLSDRLSGAVFAMITACILIGVAGPSCDSDAAAVFRQEATAPIGEGVKTIMNGVLDGLIAAVQDAGDGPQDTAKSR